MGLTCMQLCPPARLTSSSVPQSSNECTRRAPFFTLRENNNTDDAPTHKVHVLYGDIRERREIILRPNNLVAILNTKYNKYASRGARTSNIYTPSRPLTLCTATVQADRVIL